MTARQHGSRLGRLALAQRLMVNNLLVIVAGAGTVLPVSYTHLDVYKRQELGWGWARQCSHRSAQRP